MKKYILCLILCVQILFCSACTDENVHNSTTESDLLNNTSENISSSLAESNLSNSTYENINSSTIEPEKCQLKDGYIFTSGKYYRIYKNDKFEYCYHIYNSNEELVLEELVGKKFHSIDMVNEDILDIHVGMGTGIILHKYYNVRDNNFSNVFSDVIASSDELVAYIYVPKEHPFVGRKVVIQNMFDKELYYKEYEFDFARDTNPVKKASFLNDKKILQITYVTGEDFKEVTENIILE